jgi:aromatic-L-amino-acid decarboxylase
MRAMVAQAMDRIVAHLASLPEQPAMTHEGGHELARSLREGMPEGPTPFAALLDTIFDRALEVNFNTASPGYLAYIPGGGIFPSAVADLISDAINRYVGVFAAAPGFVQLEQNVVRWFCDLVGFGEGSGGFLTTGGSLANLSAVIAARANKLGTHFLEGSLYCSAHAHHSIRKAAMLAGFPPDHVRVVPSDDRFRMDPAALQRMLIEDRKDGLKPFCLVGNAGSTNTGAVDDLAALADLAESARLWFHVDAAYGGFFLLTERGREELRGIERADSVTLDPHKGLFLPLGNGSLVVREQSALKKAHSVGAAYLPDMQEEPDLVDFCEVSPELSRDFRGLRAWLPLKLFGAGVFRAALDEKMDLARYCADAVRELEGVELVAEPQLSVFAFRLNPEGASLVDAAAAEGLNALNRRWMDAINRRKRVYVTQAMLGPSFVLRVCVLHFRTHKERIDMFLEDARAALAEVGGVAEMAERSDGDA